MKIKKNCTRRKYITTIKRKTHEAQEYIHKINKQTNIKITIKTSITAFTRQNIKPISFVLIFMITIIHYTFYVKDICTYLVSVA